MASYLVTGAAGFIASRIAEMLLGDGHTVHGVDNLNDAYDVRMKEYRLRKLQALPGFTFHKLDIADRNSMLNTPALSGQPFEAVINLAARAGVRASLKDPWIFYATNVIGTLNLLELCKQQGIHRFIQASTSTVYGANAPVPTPETAATDAPPQAYAASKKAAEVLCYSYHELYQINASVVRYFTVYGPAGRPDMSMFRFARWISEGEPVQLFGDGSQTRGFTYLDDIARGTIAALQAPGYQVFNLGGHEVISMNALISVLEGLIGKQAIIKRLPSNPGELMYNQADVSRARLVLGWEPQVGLEQGIARLVEWYRNEREWAKEVSTG